jgi:CheY-like chemotaxis protein/tetratricopeptide (TPR) repeat protein
MNLTSQLNTLQSQNRNLPINERAELAGRLAKRFEKAGEYQAAYEALIEFWPDREKTPILDGLDEVGKANVLLRVGALTGWIGGANQTQNSQEKAKNLITKSIEIFEALGDARGVAEASGDLALCYWREGAYDEARIQLDRALTLLGTGYDDLKAVLLIRAGIVEVWDQKINEAMRLYYRAAPLLEKSEDHALKGAYHHEFALLFTRLGTEENRREYIDRALIEAAAASFHFEQAGNQRAVARVENNLGFLYFTIGRYQDAHEHLDRARKLFIKLKDVGTAAQVDETRARTLLAEGRLREAERMIKAAIRVLENGGQQAVLAEALTTQGTIVARLGSTARAALLLQRAIVVAETVGDREGSGRAHLTIVEELAGQTPLKQLAEIYGSAMELLQQSQDPSTNKRLIGCARSIIEAFLRTEQHAMPDVEEASWEGFSMRKHIEKIEKILMNRALRDAGGSVTKASQLLGFHHHQSLISLINSRHSELLQHRSVVRRRHHHLLSKPQKSKKRTPAVNLENQIFVLHVEDHKPVTRMVKDALGSAYHVQSATNGLTAYEYLRTQGRVDVLIVDNNLPGMSGLELVLRVRGIVHRRNLPIIMVSRDDLEKEAWRAGVDAFVRKNEAAGQLPSTIARILEERRKT